MESDKKEFIDKDDLIVLRSLKAKHDFDILYSENSINKERVSELNYENSLLKIYIKYGITLDGGLDYKDGRIVRKKKKEEKNDNEQPIQSSSDS